MSRPRIFVSCDVRAVGDPPRPSSVVNVAYVRAVERAGGLPLILPPLGARALSEALAHADGVLLIGGPDYRSAGRHPKAVYCAREREAGDFRLWAMLRSQTCAVLGICLGMQLLTIGSGGLLYQDLPSQVEGAMPHRNSRHGVRLAADSRLGALLGTRIVVNSSHHQAVRVPGRGFVVVGWAPDGVVEAVEAVGDRFVVGVQWHPERMPGSLVQRRLLEAFVHAASRGGRWT